MRKTTLTTLLLLTAAAIQAQPEWIPFTWHSSNIDGRTIEKAAMSVPVTFTQIPGKFEAQFDLGATATMLYGNTIAPYLEKYGQLKQRIDTTRIYTIQGQECPTIRKAGLSLGEVNFSHADVILFREFGDVMTTDSIETNTVKHIGSLAADLFNTAILVIDFPNRRLCRIEDRSQIGADKFDYVDMDYIEDQNWILLPLNIGGQTRKVLFDTGSSMFPLLSSPENIASIADTAQCAESLSVGAWGESVDVNGYTPKVEIRFGETLFAPLAVYASPYLDDAMLKEAGFWGVVGNRYFLDRIVVIDYKNKQFGISRK